MSSGSVWTAFACASLATLNLTSAYAGEIYSFDEVYVQTVHETSSTGINFEKKNAFISHGTYNATDNSLIINGWDYDRTPLVVAYDKPIITKIAGMSVTLNAHHFKNGGLDIYIDEGSFQTRRQVHRSSGKTCTDNVEFSLKKGHDLFEMPWKKAETPKLVTGIALVNYYCKFRHAAS